MSEGTETLFATLRRVWLRLLEARIRRIDRKQNRLSKAKTKAMIFAAQHRRKLDG